MYTTWNFLKFKFLNTRKLNQDALENTFGAICLHCGSNNNPYDALKRAIIYGLAYRSLYGTNCEDDGASLLDKLHSFLKPSNATSTSPSTVMTVRLLTVFQTLSMLEKKHNVE
jgi:hypothetical protein